MVLLLGTKFDKILDVFFLLSHVLLFMQFPLFFFPPFSFYYVHTTCVLTCVGFAGVGGVELRVRSLTLGGGH